MPRYIIRLDDAGVSHYLEWSTIADAPVAHCGTREEFRRYYQREYGRQSMGGLNERLARVDAKGVSSLNHDSLDDLIACNRAGENKTCITKEQIIDHYIRGNPLAIGNPTNAEDP